MHGRPDSTSQRGTPQSQVLCTWLLVLSHVRGMHLRLGICLCHIAEYAAGAQQLLPASAAKMFDTSAGTAQEATRWWHVRVHAAKGPNTSLRHLADRVLRVLTAQLLHLPAPGQ